MFLRYCIIIITLLFIYQCQDDPTSRNPFYGTGTPPAKRLFWAYNFTTSSHYQVQATLRAVSNQAIVYVADDQLSRISESRGILIANEFDNVIYPTLTSSFGSFPDVDGNNKVIILCLNIQDSGTAATGYIAGYFSGGQESLGSYSNISDVLYIDTYQLINSDPTFKKFYQTMAHEFTHMIEFNRQNLSEGGTFTETWISEGLAEMGAHLCYGQLTDDTSFYTSDPYSQIKNGLSLVDWKSQFANYTQSYLFMAFILSQSTIGSQIFKAFLYNSDNSISGLESVLGSYAGNNFQNTYQNWLIATYKQRLGISNSYNNVVVFGGPPFATSGVTSASIPPYSALFLKYYSASSLTVSGSSSNIISFGINGSGAVDYTNPYSTSGNGTLVSYNSDQSWRSSGSYSTQNTGTFSSPSELLQAQIAYTNSYSLSHRHCGFGQYRKKYGGRWIRYRRKK